MKGTPHAAVTGPHSSWLGTSDKKGLSARPECARAPGRLRPSLKPEGLSLQLSALSGLNVGQGRLCPLAAPGARSTLTPLPSPSVSWRTRRSRGPWKGRRSSDFLALLPQSPARLGLFPVSRAQGHAPGSPCSCGQGPPSEPEFQSWGRSRSPAAAQPLGRGGEPAPGVGPGGRGVTVSDRRARLWPREELERGRCARVRETSSTGEPWACHPPTQMVPGACPSASRSSHVFWSEGAPGEQPRPAPPPPLPLD